jgi:hypothetical protein
MSTSIDVFLRAASAANCLILRPLVPRRLLIACPKNISAYLGMKSSKIDITIGSIPGGIKGGKLSSTVSIQPNRKLWKPYGRPSVNLKNSIAAVSLNLVLDSELRGICTTL